MSPISESSNSILSINNQQSPIQRTLFFRIRTFHSALPFNFELCTLLWLPPIFSTAVSSALVSNIYAAYRRISTSTPFSTASSALDNTCSVAFSDKKYSVQFSQTSAGTFLMTTMVSCLLRVTVTFPGLVVPCLQNVHFMVLSFPYIRPAKSQI